MAMPCSNTLHSNSLTNLLSQNNMATRILLFQAHFLLLFF